jgi:DUF1680 family protein
VDEDDILHIVSKWTGVPLQRMGQDEMSRLLAVESEMPWGGKSTITVSTPTPLHAALKLRVPGWARNQPVPGSLYTYDDLSTNRTTVHVNGKPATATVDRLGYITLDRVWTNGDAIAIEFPVDARRVVANGRVKEDRGRVAIERGRSCAEWPDCDGGKALDVLVDRARNCPRLPSAIRHQRRRHQHCCEKSHEPAAAMTAASVPYYLWANHGASPNDGVALQRGRSGRCPPAASSST